MLGIKKLIGKCQKGDNRSQEKLYKHFYGYAKSITLRYAQNNEDASELVNDAFYSAFNHLDQYDHARDFKSWFRKIVVNKCIDKYKKRLPLITSDLEAAEEVVDIDHILNRLQAEELLQLLQELPHNLRITFNLYEIEGYSHKEIAQELEVSASTSRANLTRAKMKLRKQLEKTERHDQQLARYTH